MPVTCAYLGWGGARYPFTFIFIHLWFFFIPFSSLFFSICSAHFRPGVPCAASQHVLRMSGLQVHSAERRCIDVQARASCSNSRKARCSEWACNQQQGFPGNRQALTTLPFFFDLKPKLDTKNSGTLMCTTLLPTPNDGRRSISPVSCQGHALLCNVCWRVETQWRHCTHQRQCSATQTWALPSSQA